MGNDSQFDLKHQQDQLLALAQKTLPGPSYFSYLAELHQVLKPSLYVEIGIASGLTLKLARPETIVIGVDPAFQIKHSIVAKCSLYKEESDHFFARDDLRSILSGPVDFSFIDGLHTFDQAFRDFLNCERSGSEASVIAIHDVFPVNELVARRKRETLFWTGDVWKIALLLRRLCPEVSYITVPTFPSGLMICWNLVPDRVVQKDRLASEIEKLMEVGFLGDRASLKRLLSVSPLSRFLSARTQRMAAAP